MRSDEIHQAKKKLPLPVLMHRLGLGEHAKKSARCPFHEDKHDSFSVWQRSDGAWFWKCHSGCGAGDEINFLELHRRIPRGDATNIDGINQGQTQDEYSVNDGIPHYSIRDLGTVTFFSGGNKAFTFLVSGKNANSSGYSVAFDYIELEPTNRRETESLPVQAKSAAPHAVFVNANMSGGAGTLLGPNSLGDFVTYKVGVTKVGTYKVQVRTKTLNNRGIFQLSLMELIRACPKMNTLPRLGTAFTTSERLPLRPLAIKRLSS
jgi:hypothetical protein